jgi:nickel-dependent lactate racemase
MVPSVEGITARKWQSGSDSISVPWGPGGSLDLRIEMASDLIGKSDITVEWPDQDRSLSDYPEAVRRALDSPLGASRIEQQVSPGSRVAIVVDDPSRWTPVSDALPLIVQRLHASGVKPTDVTITVGVGRHQPTGSDAMRQRLGPHIVGNYQCFSPPVDDLSAYTDLGSTPQGVRVRVFEPVAKADLRILVGSVLPHLQAGFGGGLKLIFPGTSHRSTLGVLHRLGLEKASAPAGLLGGDAAANPMRQAIQAAAGRLGRCWSLSHLAGGSSQIFRVVAGDPVQVQDVLATEARRRFQAPPAALADIVVAANDPWPGDPMQSFKVLLHHQAACREGGVMVGLFWTDPAELERSFPLGLLRLIASSGNCGSAAIRGLLPFSARLTKRLGSAAAFMLHWARELVVDRSVFVYAPPLYDRLGPRLGPVRLFADLDSVWEATVSTVRRRNRRADPVRVRIFPRGGLTYVASDTVHRQ